MVTFNYTAHCDDYEHHLKEYRDEVYRDNGNAETWLRHCVAHHKHKHNLDIEMNLKWIKKKRFLDNLEYLKWIWNELEIWIFTQIWKKSVLESNVQFATDKEQLGMKIMDEYKTSWKKLPSLKKSSFGGILGDFYVIFISLLDHLLTCLTRNNY